MNKQLDCILLIDDNDADNFFHERVIKKTGCASKVVTKESGEEALEYLKSMTDGKYPKPDLIFLDINMPRMNGWEFLEEYEKLELSQKASIVLIMLSTSLNPDDEKKAKDNPLINDFVNKPLIKDNLREIIEKNFLDHL